MSNSEERNMKVLKDELVLLI